MRISIVTINKNNGAGLAKTMASVFTQEWPFVEYIIIDGGSTDNSLEIIKKYKEKISYWVSEPDNGVYEAQNKGLGKATGDYVLFLNSGDSFCFSTSISSLALKAKKNAIVYGDLQVDDGKGSYWLKKYPHKLPLNYFDYETLPHPASLIPISILRNEGGYDTSMKICADWKFFRDVFLAKNAEFIHVSEVISYFDVTGLSSKIDNQPLIFAEKKKVKGESRIKPSLKKKALARIISLWKA